MSAIDSFARAIYRPRLWWIERRKARAQTQALETFVSLTTKSKNGKLQGFHQLNQMGLYLMIASRDIQAIKVNALTHPDEWTRLLYARVMLLTVIEWKMDKVTGQKLRDAMEIMKIPQDIKDEMNQVLRVLRGISERADKAYGDIRNSAIGHRDPDALAQYRAIRDLDTAKLYSFVGEFFAAVELFIAAHIKVLNASATFQSVIGQHAEYDKKNGGRT